MTRSPIMDPLGGGRTACDDKKRQVSPATLFTGVGVCDAMPCHPSPSSMAPEGLDTMMPRGCALSLPPTSTKLYGSTAPRFTLMGQSWCMDNTWPSHHLCLLSLVPLHLRVGTGTMLGGMGRLIPWMQTMVCWIPPYSHSHDRLCLLWQLSPAPSLTQLCSFLVSCGYLQILSPIFNPLL